MGLHDITKEAENLFSDAKRSVRRETSLYQGDYSSYNSNFNRAILGVAGGLAVSLISPLAGAAVLTYGGVKAYQAYKDKKNNVRRIEGNGNNRTYGRRHTI